MTRFTPTLRACAAACLLAAALPSFADPAAPAGDALALLQAAYAAKVAPGPEADRYRELFATVLQRVQRSYAREIDPAVLADAAAKSLAPLPAGAGDPAEVFKAAINQALATLDNHTRYRDARTYSNERGESSGSFGGLGLEVESGEGAVRVIAPSPDSPAARAGLQPGDLIVRVDDRPLQGVPLSEAIARMRGEPGTPVSVTIRRAGREDEFTVSLKRDTIRRQALRWNMEDKVLVLRLATFSAPVTAAITQAIAQASAAHAPQAVVLDLRGNPGGLLREAVTTADTFLAKGEIVSLKARASAAHRSWQADAAELLAGLPMVVLVDRRSASASELVAAALQDNGRAVVMGQRSYGKGTVQTTFSLGEGLGAVKVTTSYYIGPSGRSVQDAGVLPDIELLTAPAAQPDAAAGTQVRVLQSHCPAVAADPGLACAVAYLRSGSLDAFSAATANYQP
jgi:carboxyl-terminal processing protease